MSDAANLLSILRGELPIPPQPPSNDTTPTPTQPQVTRQPSFQANQLLNQFNSQSTRQTAPQSTSTSTIPHDLPKELQEPPKPTPKPTTSDSSQSLLSILKGFNPIPTSSNSPSPASPAAPPPPVAPTLPPSTPSATTKSTPNFNFISPFDLLNSKKSTPTVHDSPLSSIPQHLNFQSTSSSSSASPSPSPAPSNPTTPSQAQSKSLLSPSSRSSPAPSSASFPTQYLSYPSIVPSTSYSSSQGLRIPSNSLPPLSIPQQLSISPLPSTHSDSLTSTPPSLTPITLFPAQSLDHPQLGGSRRIAICSNLIGYAVKKGRVRVIERESGERVLIDPFEVSSKGKEKKKGGNTAELGGIEFARNVDANGRRAICMVEGGKDGSVAVWEGMDRFDSSEKAEYRPSLIISPPTVPDCKFILAKFHPNYPNEPIVAIATNQGSVCLIHTNESSEGGKVEIKVEEMRGTKWSKGDKREAIKDITFSPDGSLLAILTAFHYKIYHTSSHSFDTPLHSSLLPSYTSPVNPYAISFLTSQDPNTSKPVVRSLVISSQKGTQLDFVGFDHLAVRIASIKLESTPDENDDRFHYSQLQYHDPSSTLFVSSSLRGSIFAFKLAFSSLPQEISSTLRSDSDTLSRLITLPQPNRQAEPSSRPVRISHVLEVPHPEPILSFVIDSKPHQQQQSPPEEYKFGSQPSPTTSVRQELGVLIHHPQGIQHVLLPSLPASTSTTSTSSQSQFTNSNPFSVPLTQSASTQSVSQDPGNLTEEESLSELEKFLATGRRMSLEGSIKVNKRVEVEEERVDEVSWEFMRRASIPFTHPEEMNEELEEKKRDKEVGEVLKKKEELPAKGDIANALNPATPREEKKEEEIKLSGPVVNAAIKSMKLAKKKEVGAGSNFQNTYKNYSSSSQSSSTPPVNGSIEEEGTVSSSPSPPQVETKTEDAGKIVEELRRVEKGLPGVVEQIVRKELESHLRSADENLSERDQELLRSVEQVVLDAGSATKRFMGDDLLPAVQDVVGVELRRNLEGAVRQILPREVSSILLDPDFTRSLASTLVPALEQTVTQLILSGLVPSFKHTLHKAVDEIMSEMKREMLGVRKEIVREQNGVVEELEKEVGGLRGEVAELKGMLQRMEGLMIASQQQQQQSQSRAVPPPPAPFSIAASSHMLSPQASQPEALPPIPRSETPAASYEDLLTTFLQPSESPSFPSLVHFLNSSPPQRLDRIFPPSSSVPPAISMAVTLSLAFRLSELVKSREGGFAENEKKWLEWLRRAVGACNDQQPPEFLAMIPRILDMVLNNLVTRGRNLMAVGDHRGAGEIRIVEQYARARLSMFSLH
ncbi:hypothetical protein JCM5353_001802 [Sporobolomyces roseus]